MRNATSENTLGKTHKRAHHGRAAFVVRAARCILTTDHPYICLPLPSSCESGLPTTAVSKHRPGSYRPECPLPPADDETDVVLIRTPGKSAIDFVSVHTFAWDTKRSTSSTFRLSAEMVGRVDAAVSISDARRSFSAVSFDWDLQKSDGVLRLPNGTRKQQTKQQWVDYLMYIMAPALDYTPYSVCTS